MATMCFAMWLQGQDISGNNRHLILILTGVVAVAVVCMTIVLLAVSLKALKALKSFGETTEEFKTKLLPLLDEVTAFSKSGREMLQDSAPKVKIITDNLLKASDAFVDTSNTARSAVQQVEHTITDANLRAQRQVARVDGMLTAALTTTSEVVDAIGNGIRGPVQKIAAAASQARFVIEGLLAKIKSKSAPSKTGGTRYGSDQDDLDEPEP